ncbi:hypothetical protein B0J14DRAFT_17692 [Halenospora varia]|nr:hypothetical protein B0J14DRAFT_17692 [Halenospora varia]
MKISKALHLFLACLLFIFAFILLTLFEFLDVAFLYRSYYTRLIQNVLACNRLLLLLLAGFGCGFSLEQHTSDVRHLFEELA